MGVAIFSKYPIVDTRHVPYKQNSAADNLVYADIDINGKKIRLMTTHLQSVRFNPVDYEGINRIKNTEDRVTGSFQNHSRKNHQGLPVSKRAGRTGTGRN